MKKWFVWIVFVVMGLGACSSAPPPPTPTPEPMLIGSVQIITPQMGTVYYTETVTIQGNAQDIPEGGFLLRIQGKDNQIIAENIVKPDGEFWSVTLPIVGNTTPQNIGIVALAPDPQVRQPYAQTTAILSVWGQRPEGIFGTIFAPLADEVLGGEQIPLNGTVSGLFEGSLTITMTDNQETIVDQQTITVPAPSPFDEVPFSADLLTNGVTGPVTITIGYISADDGQLVILDSVSIMLSVVAG